MCAHVISRNTPDAEPSRPPLPYSDDELRARLTGSFSAIGGQGNDIEVVLIDEREFPNWQNGHSVPAYYTSEGKKTTGDFDITLRPGDYRLIFNNSFSAISSKLVGLSVSLNYFRQFE